MEQVAKICFIVAVASNGVIGRDGQLPWRLPSDLKRFRKLTMGKPIIMGRKTFQSIGKPLDGRDNIVVTRDSSFLADGVLVVASVSAAVGAAMVFARERGADEVMVIGGAEIYREMLAEASRVYLTRVHCEPEGDTVFADLAPEIWKEVRREAIQPDDRDDCAATLIVLERRVEVRASSDQI